MIVYQHILYYISALFSILRFTIYFVEFKLEVGLCVLVVLSLPKFTSKLTY